MSHFKFKLICAYFCQIGNSEEGAYGYVMMRNFQCGKKKPKQIQLKPFT